jgi:hypothetical protein
MRRGDLFLIVSALRVQPPWPERNAQPIRVGVLRFRAICLSVATCRKNSVLGCAGVPSSFAPGGTSDMTPA